MLVNKLFAYWCRGKQDRQQWRRFRWRLQGRRCFLTGGLLQEADISLEHIWPKACGGRNCAANLAVSHRRLNTARGRELPSPQELKRHVLFLRHHGVRVSPATLAEHMTRKNAAVLRLLIEEALECTDS
jgi:hypothetical protein